MPAPLALLFPGQGSQYVGMAHEYEDQFTIAGRAIGIDLLEIASHGPAEKLALTEFTQPAIVAHSLALFEKLKPILKETNRTVHFVLGHSVGEYSALSAAGSLSFEDAIRAVHFRGRAMQEAVPVGVGGMTAVLRSTEEEVKKVCQLASEQTGEVVTPANFNDPAQTVISGKLAALEFVEKWFADAQTRARTVRLAVSAPFHSPLMKQAEVQLAEYLNKINFETNQLPYVANLNAQVYSAGSSPAVIKENLVGQVCGSVLWTKSIASLPTDCQFIEVGPGKILQGLIRKIRPESKIISLDGNESGTWRDFLLS